MNVLGLIPARGGSKRLPRKNILPLGGKPLIAWTIEDGLEAELVDRVVVSTDDEEIAAVALDRGAEVPFLRPAELAGDAVSDLPVVVHAARWLEDNAGYRPEAIVLLRPTTPFRAADLIDRCVRRLIDTGADSVRAVREVGHAHPYWMLKVDEEGYSEPFLEGLSVDTHYQGQMLPPLYIHDGYCDVIRRNHLPPTCGPETAMRGFYGSRRAVLINDAPHKVNIDTPEDFAIAERVLSEFSGA